LKGLIETFGDQVPLLTTLILVERRPVLFIGYVESRLLRELRHLTPHRDVYEIGRNIPTKPKDADQFILDMLRQEDVLKSESLLRRSLILAPNVESGVVEILLHFRKAWAASCMTIPPQDRVQASNVAIYDVNSDKWLNIDRSRIDTSWSANLIREAATKKNDDLIQAFLNFMITSTSNKASALSSYVSGGISNQDEIWRDIGEPSDEEKNVIASLCKSEFSVDVTQALQVTGTPIRGVDKLCNEVLGTEGEEKHSRVDKLIVRMTAEEKRIRECLEEVRCRLR
jgi:hypothetical protein